jgi:hypothetical protein
MPWYVLSMKIKSKEEVQGENAKKAATEHKIHAKTMKTPPVIRTGFSLQRKFQIHNVVEHVFPFDKLTGMFFLA